jgi:hypothetical protein
MINVIIMCEEKIDELEMKIQNVGWYVDLIETYGYEDMEGQIYKFNTARMEHEGFYIYLHKDE